MWTCGRGTRRAERQIARLAGKHAEARYSWRACARCSYRIWCRSQERPDRAQTANVRRVIGAISSPALAGYSCATDWSRQCRLSAPPCWSVLHRSNGQDFCTGGLRTIFCRRSTWMAWAGSPCRCCRRRRSAGRNRWARLMDAVRTRSLTAAFAGRGRSDQGRSGSGGRQWDKTLAGSCFRCGGWAWCDGAGHGEDFYKLLIYDAGSFFVVSGAGARHVATLVIVLPSEHEGWRADLDAHPRSRGHVRPASARSVGHRICGILCGLRARSASRGRRVPGRRWCMVAPG